MVGPGTSTRTVADFKKFEVKLTKRPAAGPCPGPVLQLDAPGARSRPGSWPWVTPGPRPRGGASGGSGGALDRPEVIV